MIDDFFQSEIYPKFYYRSTDHELFAIGRSKIVKPITIHFSTLDFDPIWSQFSSYFPQYAHLQTPAPLSYPLSSLDLSCLRSEQDFSFPDWIESIQSIQSAIQKNLIKKAVLMRPTQFYFDRPFPVVPYFKNFQKLHPSVTHFLFQPNPSQTFLGGTPELLFKRNKKIVSTIALAGTISSSVSIQHLTEDNKMIEEFEIVKNQFKDLLKVIGNPVVVSDRIVKVYGPLAHFYSDLQAELKTSIDDQDLISFFHPSAAILGYPRLSAQRLVQYLEKKPRAPYATALGFSQNDLSEVSVGIRSCVIEENRLRAFAGVGIVDKSDPQLEWNELDLKLKPLKIWGSP